VIEGYGGNDRLVGGPWSDQLHGYRGNDVLIGGGRRDWLYGENGNDVIYARDGVRDHVVSCGEGTDTAYVDRQDPVSSDCERVIRR
jgi:Ca2+-binding RTX toxin-like protein